MKNSALFRQTGAPNDPSKGRSLFFVLSIGSFYLDSSALIPASCNHSNSISIYPILHLPFECFLASISVQDVVHLTLILIDSLTQSISVLPQTQPSSIPPAHLILVAAAARPRGNHIQPSQQSPTLLEQSNDHLTRCASPGIQQQ